jgi:pyrroline-5-carboxylate reductase
MLTNLLLVGCGKMGGAILQRIAAQAKICVVEPAPIPAALKALPEITWLASADRIAKSFVPDIVILAVKPQHMDDVLPAYGRYRAAVFLSIAAGKTLNKLSAALGGTPYSIVRAMPNLPASIGQGMTVAVANKNVTPKQRALCEQCMKAVGAMVWTQDENDLDAVGALSGSGPAYVFALAEAMAKAGEALGLHPELAAQLARQTVIGSGALLAQSPESAEKLRIAVTSPGGITEAALKHLLAANGLPDLMRKAIEAAARRSKELS